MHVASSFLQPRLMGLQLPDIFKQDQAMKSGAAEGGFREGLKSSLGECISDEVCHGR